MRIFKLLLFLAIIVWNASCTPQKKSANTYLQNMPDTIAPIVTSLPDAIIQKNDILSIRVYSMSINPATDLPYNLPEQVGAGGSGAATGFLVDPHGNIEYPRLGTIHVAGLTKEELGETIKKKLEGQLMQPTVNVRFLNYRRTILGEVRSPGTYTVPTDKITKLEALG